MIVRAFADRDTTITNLEVSGVPATGSNFGGSEVLKIFKIVQNGGNDPPGIARVIAHFPVDPFISAVQAGQMPHNTNFTLRLFGFPHLGRLPADGFVVQAQALSESWSEGTGLDIFDPGYANWTDRMQGVPWAVSGSTGTGSIYSCILEDNTSDLSLDVTNLVGQYISGALDPADGVVISLTPAEESDGFQYDDKLFHSSKTHLLDKRPYIQAAWDDSIRDDRGSFVFGYPNNVYLYNFVRGQPTDLVGVGSGSLNVSLVDVSGNVAGTPSGSWVATGVYSATFSVSSGSYSGSVLHDIWKSGSVAFMTGSFFPQDDFALQSGRPPTLFYDIGNLRDSYLSSEIVRLNMFVRPVDYNPASVLTASSDASGISLSMAYYGLANASTEQVVVPFDTGSVQSTRMSYDRDGNYFKLNMGILAPGEVYRVMFFVQSFGQDTVVDQGFRFRIDT